MRGAKLSQKVEGLRLLLPLWLWFCSSSARPSDRPFATQELRTGSLVLPDFLHEVRWSQTKKLDEAWFLKKWPDGSRGPKKSQKWGYRCFDKDLIHSIIFFILQWQRSYPFNLFFILQYESTNDVLTLCKSWCLGKIWFLKHGRKASRLVRMEDSLNYNISLTSWDMKLNFCMWLESLETTNLVSYFKCV